MSPRLLRHGLLSAQPGLIPWARISGGTVTIYTTANGDTMKVHTFTANSTLTVEQPGYADVLLVGGGAGGTSGYIGGGGDILRGLHFVPAGSQSVAVGAGGVNSVFYGGNSAVGSLTTSLRGVGNDPSMAMGGGATVGARNQGLTSAITGATVEYARGNQGSPRPNFGDGGNSVNGSSGIVIVAVRI